MKRAYRFCPHSFGRNFFRDTWRKSVMEEIQNEYTSSKTVIHPVIYGGHYIVTNPPYRLLSSGRTSPDMGRNIAGKEIAVTIKDIVKVSQQLLKVRGKFSIVYTAGRLVDLLTEMRTYRIEPKTIRCIYTKEDGEARLLWVEGVKEGKPGIRIFSFSNNL